jgi:4-hydroxy-3-polyprenylbenzoate decarboxylase
MKYYKDLRDHIAALEANDKLVRIRRPIVKETELMPLVRWQFRGLPEEMRKAFLFENVIDVKGRKYGIPVLAASHAASRQVYAIGMMCRPEEIENRFVHAHTHPFTPKLIESGPAQEEIHLGDKLLEHGGLEEFPVPISTPGFDNAPYLTAGFWISKDPDTGIGNVGCYRAMVKSKTRLGIFRQEGQHLGMQWEKCKAKGIPLRAAIVVGTSPNIGYASVTRLPFGQDELYFAGGIAGEPVELIKCKTIDIEVPATSEIVIEGELPTDFMEREAPFGEYNGYMGMEEIGPYLNVTCITHRRSPIFNAFVSQFPPSESSKLREIGEAAHLYKFLKYDCNIPSVLEVVQHESVGSSHYCVIRLKKQHPAQVWQALNLLSGRFAGTPKFVIAVDEDIDPKDPDSVNWALCWRVQPHRDMRIVTGKTAAMDPSAHLPDSREAYPFPTGGSMMLIDATRKWDYPPVSLPRKEFMERARQIWEEEQLPKLTPKVPWFGYPLGYWTDELEEEAQLALKGEHFQTGEKLAKNRIKA